MSKVDLTGINMWKLCGTILKMVRLQVHKVLFTRVRSCTFKSQDSNIVFLNSAVRQPRDIAETEKFTLNLRLGCGLFLIKIFN